MKYCKNTETLKSSLHQLRLKHDFTMAELSSVINIKATALRCFELDVLPMPYVVAEAICRLFSIDITELFPAADDFVKSELRRARPRETDKFDIAIQQRVADAGIDMSFETSDVNCRFAGGFEHSYRTTVEQTIRLMNALEAGSGFCTMKSVEFTIAINLRQLASCRIVQSPIDSIVDCEFYATEAEASPVVQPSSLNVLFAESETMVSHRIEGDLCDATDESTGICSLLLSDLEDDDQDVVSFYEDYPNIVYLRPEKVALLEMPMWALHPDLLDENEYLVRPRMGPLN